MSTLELEHRWSGFEDPDPLSRLLRFYEANSYSLADPRQAAQSPMLELEMTRGVAGAGWLSSDMTRLHARVSLRLILEADDPDSPQDAPVVVARYRVDIRGQVLKDEDRQFWQREAQSAQDFLRAAENTEPPDLVAQESERAQSIRRGSLSIGLKVGAGLGLLIFLCAYIAHHLGLI